MDTEVEETAYTCRACLSVTTSTVPIFETICQDVELTTIFLKSGLELTIDKKFPRTLCIECLEKLINCYNFIQTYKNSQDVLTAQLGSSDLNQNQEKSTNTELSESNDEGIKVEQDDDNFEEIVVEPDQSDLDCTDDEENQRLLIEKSIELTEVSNANSEQEEYKIIEIVGKKPVHNKKTITTYRDKGKNFKIFSCRYCTRSFRQWPAFSIHLKQEHNHPMTCDQCNLELCDAEVYINHFKTKHFYECKRCDRSFNNYGSYSHHMHNHNNTARKYHCTQEGCTKYYASKHCLRTHMETIHQDRPNYLCTLCGETFKGYDQLMYHKKKHRGASHLCTFCGKVYMQAIHLKYHMWRHTGVKPLNCKTCKKGFLDNLKFKRHLVKFGHEACKKKFVPE